MQKVQDVGSVWGSRVWKLNRFMKDKVNRLRWRGSKVYRRWRPNRKKDLGEGYHRTWGNFTVVTFVEERGQIVSVHVDKTHQSRVLSGQRFVKLVVDTSVSSMTLLPGVDVYFFVSGETSSVIECWTTRPSSKSWVVRLIVEIGYHLKRPLLRFLESLLSRTLKVQQCIVVPNDSTKQMRN